MILFLEIAQRELDEAVAFQETLAQGLGQTLLADVLAALDLVSHYPKAWHPVSTNTRRCRMHRFPCGIFYLDDESDILIVAIAHLHRRPGYWSERIQFRGGG